ncbi:hypothetical protein WQQ_20970 [Hydrocarboniphaga effusa AP103]|uniref:Uncharacterized protein n=1 Tax=Hydrocarboniphaga effusa AP103 TaxID=1172194 RepID=I8TDC6_9GAMM|nr:hypothetical protein WQQ_20970 [Hydrocarboniphaga effusa AP103]
MDPGNFSKGFRMRHQPTPVQSAASVSTGLFRNRLDAQIDLRHSLCKRSAVMSWDAMAQRCRACCQPNPRRAAVPLCRCA